MIKKMAWGVGVFVATLFFYRLGKTTSTDDGTSEGARSEEAALQNASSGHGSVEVFDVQVGNVVVPDQQKTTHAEISYAEVTVSTKIVGGSRSAFTVECWVGSSGNKHTKVEVSAGSGSFPAGQIVPKTFNVYFASQTRSFAGEVQCKAH